MQLVLDAVPLQRVSSMEFKKPETPGRGVSRRGSLFRCNSIIDGHELDVSGDDRLLTPDYPIIDVDRGDIPIPYCCLDVRYV